eukprot:3508250-Rhodomonas_salina.1
MPRECVSEARVLVPINLSNDHWISACLDVELRSVSICDSLGGNNKIVGQNLAAWFEAVFPLQGKPVSVSQVPIDKQIDADCGVASMMFT